MASERRWWKATKTPGQALWLGLAWIVGGTVELVLVLVFGLKLLQLVLALWFLCWGAYFLAAYAMMRRHGWAGSKAARAKH